MRNVSKFIVVIAVVVCSASLALAAEQTILGRKFIVRRSNKFVFRQMLVGVGNEKSSPNTIVGDPTLAGSAGGAILEFSVFGTGVGYDWDGFSLPQGTSSAGKPFWIATGTGGFKYRDPRGDQGGVRTVAIKRSPSGVFTIKVRTFDGGLLLYLWDRTAACMALKLGMGSTATGDRYSVQFGSDGRVTSNADKLFSVEKPTLEGISPCRPSS